MTSEKSAKMSFIASTVIETAGWKLSMRFLFVNTSTTIIFNKIPSIIIDNGIIWESIINSEGISFILNKILFTANKRPYLYFFIQLIKLENIQFLIS